MNELLPCAHCGSEKAVELRTPIRLSFVWCNPSLGGCGASGATDLYAEAIARWNRRAGEEALRVELAETKHKLDRSDEHYWKEFDGASALMRAHDALREALKTSPCPFPIEDFGTVGACVDANKCGCDNSAALRGKP